LLKRLKIKKEPVRVQEILYTSAAEKGFPKGLPQMTGPVVFLPGTLFSTT